METIKKEDSGLKKFGGNLKKCLSRSMENLLSSPERNKDVSKPTDDIKMDTMPVLPSHRTRNGINCTHDKKCATYTERLKKEYDHQVKILLIGDAGVGKTSLIFRYADDVFSPTYISTLGIDFKTKIVEHNQKTVKIQLWDTAGQERFRNMTTHFYRGANGVVITFDVTKPCSFENVEYWLEAIHKYSKDDIVSVLVGNKTDLNITRAVTREQGQALADTYGLSYFETSAKKGTNVEDVFQSLTRDIIHQMSPKVPQHRKSIKLKKDKKKFKLKCFF